MEVAARVKAFMVITGVLIGILSKGMAMKLRKHDKRKNADAETHRTAKTFGGSTWSPTTKK